MSADSIPAGSVPIAETSALISSDRVNGTPVFGREGDKLGIVHHVMIDKRTGQVAYVVVSTGGFLGLGQSYHPLPWNAFRYEQDLEGYSVTIDKRMLDGGPSFRPDSAPDFDDAYGKRVTDYYQIRPAAM